MYLLIFLHFTLITAIICLVLMQRSSESSVLTASTHFAPGGANKILIKITRILVIIFMTNCLLISYVKYGQNFNKKNVNISTSDKNKQNNSVPTE